ncbi:unnamed protein product [Brassica oleracea var. botrytis]|nr:unnamed protein product [Brassica napus]CDY33825.1 BnaCnng07430D [Brassica napus]VDD62140.1 unnamed protein product [Brassica oleracea]
MQIQIQIQTFSPSRPNPFSNQINFNKIYSMQIKLDSCTLPLSLQLFESTFLKLCSLLSSY